MGRGNEISRADSLTSSAFRAALAEIEAEGFLGAEVRERQHLDPAVKRSFERLTRKTASSIRFQTDFFSGLGPVDVVVAEPSILIELKWSYDEKRSKIFESVWDAIKLSILAVERECLAYVATGASRSAWSNCESADLFSEATVDPCELWSRALAPPGPNGGVTVGEDLILGSPSGGHPNTSPKRLAISPIDQISYRGDYELRLIRVAGDGPMQPWPESD
jgi:hypothetical protein